MAEKHIYLIRHGETLFNVQHRTQGWSDSPLTENGIRQAKAAGEFMRDFGVNFDAYYSSTSERACDTLELVFPGVAYMRVKGFKETNFGAFEANPQYLEPSVPRRREFFREFGGENWDDVADRVKQQIIDIFEAHPEQETIFGVSHGAAMSHFMRLISPLDQAESWDGLHNLEMLHYTYDPDTGAMATVEKIRTLSGEIESWDAK
ncbi:MAG: histidine phosphatase family protein [Streptococcaceae bacterium]|jgi:probable phosphoglycerate mutase|nr:histidine phosphatase family protein [Streptococcaceae bacterium]